MDIDESRSTIEVVFESANFPEESGLSASYLSDFLRQIVVLHIFAAQQELPDNYMDIKPEELWDFGGKYCVRTLIDNLSRRNPELGKYSHISYSPFSFSPKLVNIQKEIDSLYHELFSNFKLMQGESYTPSNVPTIESISLNSPLSIKLSGATKALVISLCVCGGTVDFKEGKAELPGLISVVEKINHIIKDHLETDYSFSSPSKSSLDLSSTQVGYTASLPNKKEQE